MKQSLLLVAGLLAISPVASAQTTVLYEQNWGTGSSATALSQVGWSQVLLTNGYSGFYTFSPPPHDGATGLSLPANEVYFGGNSGVGIFYTTNGAGSGSLGNSSFTSIDPTPHTNLNLSVYCSWSWQGSNVTCWFAVQVGGAWYASTNKPLTTAAHSNGDTFYNFGITYDPAATNWNVLTVGPSVSVGGPAPSNLSGNITGLGVVMQLSGAGSWNFSRLQISSISNTVTLPPTLTAAPISQTSYEGAGVSFAVAATGTGPFTYIWTKDGVTTLTNGGRFSGATNSILTISNLGSGDMGTYSVIVSNSAGWFDTSTNTTATLTVNSVPADYLYAETFPFVGALAVGYPISVVGWSNAIADNVNRLYQTSGGDGAAYAFESAASTKAFYVTTNSDRGVSGLPFKKITPSGYPAVSFYVDIAPFWAPANVTAYIAVQMNGGSWYVNSTALPVDTSTATPTFTTYRQQFDPLAAQWNTLTIGTTSATIGGPAGSNLTGDITGAGVVFVYTGAGTFDIDNFLVTTNAAPPIAPTITFSPFSQTVYSGAGVAFAVNATGTRPFAYYWQKDGLPLSNGGRISGADSNILTLVNVGTNDAGQYSVIVSNGAGTDSSASYLMTVLTVNDPPVGLLYLESFPFVGPGLGNYPLSVVGWQNAIPNNPDRLFQNAGGDGAGYAYQNGLATTAFFVTPTFDPGTSGRPFPNMNLAFWPSLIFSVDIAPANSPTNVSAAIAVQMNGGPWYVSATNLPVDTSIETTTYSSYTQIFTPNAANWKNLTLVAGSGATIGSTASTNLNGTITGAGLVFSHIGSGGTFNFDNFQINGTGIGGITIGPVSGNTISLSWIGNPAVHLQSATNLNPPVVFWSDVANTTGASTAIVTNTAPQMFFRLIQP